MSDEYMLNPILATPVNMGEPRFRAGDGVLFYRFDTDRWEVGQVVEILLHHDPKDLLWKYSYEITLQELGGRCRRAETDCRPLSSPEAVEDWLEGRRCG